MQDLAMDELEASLAIGFGHCRSSSIALTSPDPVLEDEDVSRTGTAPIGPTSIRLRSVPVIRLETIQRGEFLAVLCFVVVVFVLCIGLLISAPEWSLTRTEYPINYCTFSSVQPEPVFNRSAKDTCSYTCWGNGNAYATKSQDEIKEGVQTCQREPVGSTSTTANRSCPYNGVEMRNLGVEVAGPLVEFTISDFNEYKQMRGRFDTFLSLKRAHRAGAVNSTTTGGSNTTNTTNPINGSDVGVNAWDGLPYSMLLDYTVLVQGQRVGSDLIETKTLFRNNLTLECPGAEGPPCTTRVLPAYALQFNDCANLMGFDTIQLRITWHAFFSVLQPTLNTTLVGQGNNTALQVNTVPYATADPLNESALIYQATSNTFMYAILGVHVGLGVVMLMYLVRFVKTCYGVTQLKMKDWIVERKWAVVQIGCAIVVAADPVYLLLWSPLITQGTDTYMLLVTIDSLLINTCLGLVFFFNLCFLASFRSQAYRPAKSWRFYIDKTIFLAVWLLVSLTLSVFKHIKTVSSVDTLSPATEKFEKLNNALYGWSNLLVYVYCLAVLGIAYITNKAMRGEWNYGVRHRQLGFRAMMLFQGLFLTIAILEISVVPKHYWSDSYAVAKYSPYTGFATLFIGTSMVLNIFVVVTVFANTYGYLPPKAKHLIGSDVELSLLTTSTHVHKVFSLYTAYWMCAGSILAYTYVENVIKLRKERKKAMKKKKRSSLEDEPQVAARPVVGVRGYEEIAYITDARTDTHVIIFRHSGELVITFRGTDSASNAMTDLRAYLIPICCNTLPDRPMKTSDRKDSESTQHIHTPPYFDTEEDTTDIHAHVHHINDNTDTHAHVHQNERSMSHHDTIDMGSDTVHAKLLTNVSSTRLSLGVNRDDIEMAVHGEAEVMSGGGRSSVGALREQRFEETILGADERVHRPYTAMRGDRVSGAPIIGGPDHEVDRGNGMESECGRHMESQCELVGDSGDRSSARKRNQERVDSGASDTDDAGTESVTHKKVVRRKLHSCRGAEAIECHRENILVHRGFLRAFQAIRDEVVAVIREQMNRHIQEVEPNEQHPESDNGTGSAPYSGPGDRTDNRTTPNNTEAKHTPLSIFITGHSLGGALATLCAYELGLRFDTSQLGLTVYTFGSPRVGNKPFTQKFNRMISHCHRLVNDGDIVTGVPKFRAPGFMHVTYKHVGSEYVLGQRGEIMYNPTFTERLFEIRAKNSAGQHSCFNYRSVIVRCISEMKRRAIAEEEAKNAAIEHDNDKVKESKRANKRPKKKEKKKKKNTPSYDMVTAIRTMTTVLQAPAEMYAVDVSRDEGQAIMQNTFSSSAGGFFNFSRAAI